MNEFELIQDYFNWPIKDPSIALGIGDDAALFSLKDGQQLVTTTDTLSEGVHFFKDALPSDIAYKSLAVNLSDIAAMGASAKYFTLALTLPKIDHDWIEEFSKSLKHLSEYHKVSLIGGDTTKGPLNITITMMGVVETSRALLRSGAGIGDGVYVSGTIGDAALCLKKLRDGLVPSKEELLKLNRPTPRLELGMGLKGVASSCIDISDGLEQDLSHILMASNVGAVIDVKKLPLSESVLGYIKNNEDWSIPLCGGDDYELCFTVPESNKKSLKTLSQSCNMDITKIGDINDSKELKIEGYDGSRSSYQHF